MRTSIPICSAIGAIVLCGCTELEVKRAEPGMIEGIVYTLPKKTFVVTITYELKSCEPDVPLPLIHATKAVGVVATTLPDENERFYIPYTSLRNWFKDTNITVESHDNQTLKSVSSIVNDKTGQAITSVVSTAIKLATFGAGAASARASGTPECNPGVTDALDKLKPLRGKKEPTAEETATIAELRARLTHRQVVYWSPVKPAQPMNPFVVETTVYPAGLVGKDGAWVRGTYARFEGQLQTTVQITAHEKIIADPQTVPSGFLMRHGPSATLRVCEGPCPVPKAEDNGAVWTDETRVLERSVHVIPQLGSYVGLPLKNRLFENQTLSITMSAEGAITKMGLQSNAMAVAALENLGTQVDALSKAKAERDKADAAAAAAAQSAVKNHADQVQKENNAIAECLKAQKAVREAGGTTAGTCQ